jgi:hypothetical protein
MESQILPLLAQHLEAKLQEMRWEIEQYTQQAEEKLRIEYAKNILLKNEIEDLNSQIKVWEGERNEVVAAYHIIEELIQSVKDGNMGVGDFHTAVVRTMQEEPK